MEPRQQMRRVRAAIEHKVLQPNGLLGSVVHFDTQMSSCENLPRLTIPECMATEEGGGEESGSHLPIASGSNTTTNSTDTGEGATSGVDSARVFVRFRVPEEAQAFADLCGCASTSDSDDCTGLELGNPRAIVLEGWREQAYCAAIAAAKAGGAERRRRAQAAKRRKKALHQQPQVERQQHPHEVEVLQLRKPLEDMPKPTRIVFDDE